MTTLARTHVATRRNVPPFDLILLTATLLVSVIGVVMVYTATRGSLLAQGEDPKTFLKKQGLFVVLGVITMVVVALIDYRRIEPVANILYWLIVLALLGVFVVGSSAQGAARWFSLGPLQLQPSEFAVLALILAVAAYCARREEEGLAWRDVFRLLIMAGIPIILVLLQPDLGTAMIMAIVLLVLLAVAGLPIRILVMLLVATALLAVVAVEGGLLQHYQIARLTTFLNPNSHSTNRFVQSAIYNTQQAKNAIGSGGWFGSGIGHGVETNLGYVPEQQTDFIFTAVAEQLGFVGSVGVLVLLGVIAWRVLHAAVVARDTFGRLICSGLFAFFAFSVFQNAGMTMGIMPITGIPLPFLSYGGTAVLVFFGAVGLALSVGARRKFR
ncbi:MAG TPA: rod shape-determining protein RodA [Acidimicrobiales bacterium]|jgi:rod shape determining protein RodA|nr:rod shape-determining protein RodA [Acidimicrobiales bacterium]